MKPLLAVFKSIGKLPADFYHELIEYAGCLTLKKGAQLKRAGQLNDELYLIEKGVVRGYYLKETGRQETVWFKKENDFLLQLQLVCANDEANKELEMDLLEDGILWVLPGSAVTLFLRKYPRFNFHLMHVVMNEIFAIQERVRQERDRNPSLTYDRLRQQSPDLLKRVPAKYLASYLGITEKKFLHLHESVLHLPMSSQRRRPRKK